MISIDDIDFEGLLRFLGPRFHNNVSFNLKVYQFVETSMTVGEFDNLLFEVKRIIREIKPEYFNSDES